MWFFNYAILGRYILDLSIFTLARRHTKIWVDVEYKDDDDAECEEEEEVEDNINVELGEEDIYRNKEDKKY